MNLAEQQLPRHEQLGTHPDGNGLRHPQLQFAVPALFKNNTTTVDARHLGASLSEQYDTT